MSTTSCSNMFCKLYQNNCDIETKIDTVVVPRTIKVMTTEIDTFTITQSSIDTIITTNCDSIVQNLNNLSIENDAVKTTVKVKKDQNGTITAKVETERKEQNVIQPDSTTTTIEVNDTTINQVDTIPCEPEKYIPEWIFWCIGFSILFNLILIFIATRK